MAACAIDSGRASFKVPPLGDSLQRGTRVTAGGSEKVVPIYIGLTERPTHPRGCRRGSASTSTSAPLTWARHVVEMPTCLYVSSIDFFRGDGCTSGGVGFQVPRS